MRMLSKYAASVAIAGALAFAAATPSQARWYGHGWHGHGWHNGAAIGFGVGALVGAAAANAAYPGYYGYGYAYAPDDAYYAPYAYEPAYAAPYYGPGTAPACAGSLGYGRPDYSSC